MAEVSVPRDKPQPSLSFENQLWQILITFYRSLRVDEWNPAGNGFQQLTVPSYRAQALGSRETSHRPLFEAPRPPEGDRGAGAGAGGADPGEQLLSTVAKPASGVPSSPTGRGLLKPPELLRACSLTPRRKTRFARRGSASRPVGGAASNLRGLEGAGSKLAVTTQEPGGEAAMEELVSPITTMAGGKKKNNPHALAHRATGGLNFPRPLPGGVRDPACDFSGPPWPRCGCAWKEDGHCRPGARDP